MAKSVPITARVDRSLKRELRRIAKVERRTLSQVVSFFLEQGVHTTPVLKEHKTALAKAA